MFTSKPKPIDCGEFGTQYVRYMSGDECQTFLDLVGTEGSKPIDIYSTFLLYTMVDADGKNLYAKVEQVRAEPSPLIYIAWEKGREALGDGNIGLKKNS